VDDAAALSRCGQMIIELHPGAHKGQSYDVDEVRVLIESAHGFRLTARHRNVFVFEKP
jgi:hypothetical protein